MSGRGITTQKITYLEMKALWSKILPGVAGFLFAINCIAQTGAYVPELVNFDTAMAGLLSRYNVPGGQLAITYQGRLVYNRGFGYADRTTSAPVQPESVFRLASVSKTITSVAIMYLVEKGLLHLGDTVFGSRGILNDPEYRNILDTRVFNIKVRNLLNHCGGWNREISGDPISRSYSIAVDMGVTPPAGSVTTIAYVLSRQSLDFNPGTQWQYSNLGFSILGRIIEKITGQSYENYVRNTIMLPLGADIHRGFNLQSGKLPNEVTYYDYPGAPYVRSIYDNTTLVPAPYGFFNIEGIDAEGGWVASAVELCKFLGAIDKFPSRPDILLSRTIDTMVRPFPVYPSYAKGWFVNSYGTWWHSGSLPGTTTYISRNAYQMNWAILLNSRPLNSGPLANATQLLFWNVMPTITKWPDNDLSTGLQDEEEIPGIKIWPNPSDGRFTVTCDTKISSLEIFNLMGIKVYSRTADESENMIDIDISESKGGIYLLRINCGPKAFTSKILIK